MQMIHRMTIHLLYGAASSATVWGQPPHTDQKGSKYNSKTKSKPQRIVQIHIQTISRVSCPLSVFI